jgi:S1-C subfamily serine protease
MIDERLVAPTQRSRNTLINSIAAGLGVVVLAAGIFVYLQRTLRTHDPKADSLSQNAIPEPIQDVQPPPMESMSASQIVNIYGSATVYFEVTWKLVSASTGEPVYQRYIDGSPAYKYNPKGIAEPWLTRYKQESARNPVAIGQSLRGSGFVVEKSGFILTCRHLVEPWNFPVSLPDGYIYDPKDLKKRLSPITNQDWIPAQTQQRDVPDVQGRLEHARVAFAKSEVSIPAQVIRTSNKSDVALVKVDVPQLLRTVDWDVSYTKIQAGDPITILGYPGNSPDLVEGVHVPTVITGVIGKVIREERDQKDFISFVCRTCIPTDFFQLTANIGSGGSGGPVFDQRGKVIAIYFARRRTSDGAQVTYALPIKYGTDLMEINPLVGKD